MRLAPSTPPRGGGIPPPDHPLLCRLTLMRPLNLRPHQPPHLLLLLPSHHPRLRSLTRPLRCPRQLLLHLPLCQLRPYHQVHQSHIIDGRTFLPHLLPPFPPPLRNLLSHSRAN
ncbi:unnamed protein product [Closterium sp. NIES-53]